MLVPVYEDTENGDKIIVSEEMPVRSLDFNTLNKVGYYNLGERDMNIRYTLYVMEDGAEEFIEMTSGYFGEDGEGNLCSLSEDDMEQYKKRFWEIEEYSQQDVDEAMFLRFFFA